MATIVYKVHECVQRREEISRETEKGWEGLERANKEKAKLVWYADL